MEVSKVSGAGLTPADTADMDKFFEKMTLDVELWISKSDIMLRKMSAKANIKDLEGMDIVLEVGYGLPTLGGDVKLEVPADAKEFDPSSLLGGMMGAPVSDPAAIELPEGEAPADFEVLPAIE